MARSQTNKSDERMNRSLRVVSAISSSYCLLVFRFYLDSSIIFTIFSVDSICLSDSFLCLSSSVFNRFS